MQTTDQIHSATLVRLNAVVSALGELTRAVYAQRDRLCDVQREHGILIEPIVLDADGGQCSADDASMYPLLPQLSAALRSADAATALACGATTEMPTDLLGDVASAMRLEQRDVMRILAAGGAR